MVINCSQLQRQGWGMCSLLTALGAEKHRTCKALVASVSKRPYVHQSCRFQVLVSSSSGFPNPLEEEFDGDILFRSEFFSVSHALHIVWLVVSIFFLSVIGGSFYNGVKAMHCSLSQADFIKCHFTAIFLWSNNSILLYHRMPEFVVNLMFLFLHFFLNYCQID